MGAESRKYHIVFAVVLAGFLVYLVATLKTGGGTGSSAGPNANFQTPWQDEAQYVVEYTCTDIAEMLYHSRYRRGLGESFWVDARIRRRKEHSLQYEVEVKLEDEGLNLKVEVPIEGSIWDPSAYQAFAGRLRDAIGCKAEVGKVNLDPADLTNPTPETIAKWDKELSTHALPNNPEWNELSALLLLSFALREHSGDFFDIRHELNRATAHLAVAECLKTPGTKEDNLGTLDRAMLATLYNNESVALKALDGLPEESPYKLFRRALRIRLTSDWMSVSDPDNLLESREAFFSRYIHSNRSKTWQSRPEKWSGSADWYRAANEHLPGVQAGHEIQAGSLAAEQQEQTQICTQYGWGAPSVELLNQVPRRCFEESTCGVLGKGTWAAFWQRHLLHTLQQNYEFLARKLCIPEQAQATADLARENFAGLTLFPLLENQLTLNESVYREAQVQAMSVIRSRPHLVPAMAWNNVCNRPSFCERYIPPPHAFVNEWHYYNPLPGTAYNLIPRLNHPSFFGAKNYLERLQEMHEMSPLDLDIDVELLKAMREKQVPVTHQMVEQIYGPLVAYSPLTAKWLSDDPSTPPARSDQVLEAAAKLNSDYLDTLAYRYRLRGQDEKAVQALELWQKSGPDSVTFSSVAGWLSHYYETHGGKEKATRIAEEASGTYSSAGLRAKAILHFERGEYEEALALVEATGERYNEWGPLLNFLTMAADKDPKGPWKAKLDDALKGYVHPLVRFSPDQVPANGSGVSVAKDWGPLRKGDWILAARGYLVSSPAAFYDIWNWDSSLPVPVVVERGQGVQKIDCPAIYYPRDLLVEPQK